MENTDSVTTKICGRDGPWTLDFGLGHYLPASKCPPCRSGRCARNAGFRAAEFGGIHDAGVNEFVHDDDVVPAEQGGDVPDGGGVTGGKNQAASRAFEGGKGFFQFVERASEPQINREAPAPPQTFPWP